MYTTYEAVLHGDTIEWEGERPAGLSQGKAVKVHLTVLEETPSIPSAERRKQMAEALERLAQGNSFQNIGDPVEWQKEIRKDRPLPGRE